MASAKSAESAGGGGNTISPPPFVIHPAKRWCFTLNNYTDEEYCAIKAILQKKSLTWIIGKEVGDSGTPHLQGYVEFTKKLRPLGLFDSKRIHFEKSKGDREQNYDYCSKDNDFECEGFTNKPNTNIKIIKELYPWQKSIEDIYLTEPDERKIYWYWEPDGNCGKSAFIKYMVVKHKCLFCSGGKYTDIMNLVFNQDMNVCKAILFDIPRANAGNISYASLESIKNGLVCNTKYETGCKVFNSPHVFVFANKEPDNMDMLSQDRWVITKL